MLSRWCSKFIKYFLSYIISFKSTDQNDPDPNDHDQNDRDRNVPDPNDRDRNVPDPNDRDQNDLDPFFIDCGIRFLNSQWNGNYGHCDWSPEDCWYEESTGLRLPAKGHFLWYITNDISNMKMIAQYLVSNCKENKVKVWSVGDKLA